MHDYFDILGVSRDARPTEIRRACGRRVHASHPDIHDGERQVPAMLSPTGVSARANGRELADEAIDFVDVATIVDAMRVAFFA